MAPIPGEIAGRICIDFLGARRRRNSRAVGTGARCTAVGRPASVSSVGRNILRARAALLRAGDGARLGLQPGRGGALVRGGHRADPRCALCWWGLAWSLGPNINADMDAAAARRVHVALARAARAGAVRRRAPPVIATLSARPPSADPAIPRRPSTKRPTRERMRALARATRAMRTSRCSRPKRTQPASLRLVGHADGTAAAVDARRSRAQLARALAHGARASRREPLLDPPDGISAQSGRALASAAPARDAGAGVGPPAAHAGAHLHAHRPLRRRDRGQRALDRRRRALSRRRSMRRAPTASATSRTTTTSSGRRPRWRAAAPSRSRPRDAAYPAACGPAPADRSTGILQHYYVLPLFALVRFGRWREILEETLPPDVTEPYPLAIWHYARGTACAKTRPVGRSARGARAARALPRTRRCARTRIKNINAADALVRSRALTLQADIAAAEGKAADAVAPLTEATAIEDGLSLRRAAPVARPDAARAGRRAARGGPRRRRRARLPRGPAPLSRQRLVAFRPRRSLAPIGAGEEARAALQPGAARMALGRRSVARLALLTQPKPLHVVTR